MVQPLVETLRDVAEATAMTAVCLFVDTFCHTYEDEWRGRYSRILSHLNRVARKARFWSDGFATFVVLRTQLPGELESDTDIGCSRVCVDHIIGTMRNRCTIFE